MQIATILASFGFLAVGFGMPAKKPILSSAVAQPDSSLLQDATNATIVAKHTGGFLSSCTGEHLEEANGTYYLRALCAGKEHSIDTKIDLNKYVYLLLFSPYPHFPCFNLI